MHFVPSQWLLSYNFYHYSYNQSYNRDIYPIQHTSFGNCSCPYLHIHQQHCLNYNPLLSIKPRWYNANSLYSSCRTMFNIPQTTYSRNNPNNPNNNQHNHNQQHEQWLLRPTNILIHPNDRNLLNISLNLQHLLHSINNPHNNPPSRQHYYHNDNYPSTTTQSLPQKLYEPSCYIIIWIVYNYLCSFVCCSCP